MRKVDHYSTELLVDQFCDIIREAIDTGELAPGAWLDSERQLQISQDLGRSTIQKGLKRLVAEGRIAARHGRGYFVVG